MPLFGSKKPQGGEDFTIMPVCLGLPYNQFVVRGAEDFKKCEYMFFIGAELSRLVYADVAIIQESIKALGLSPDILNEVISTYDWAYLSKRRSYTSGVPAPDSYTKINVCSTPATTIKYISSPTDTTCMIVNPSCISKNGYSIIQPTDSILVFKGSSSLRNWSKNVGSMKASSSLESISKTNLGITFSPDLKIATSFLDPVLEIFENILDAIQTVTPGAKRLFIFGHSKGGAECEVTGMLFALLLKDKQRFPAIASLEQVHMISYGAPKVVASSSLDDFNKAVFYNNTGNVTLTRIESVGRLLGDIVTNVPPASVHPGVTDTSNTLDELRKKYANVKVDGNYRRNQSTWPFEHAFDLWDRPKEVKEIAAKITKLSAPTPEELKTLESETTPLLEGGDVSNYVKAKGARNAPFSHVEQFGMYFMGSQRLPGMKNPANTVDGRTFTADIDKTCSSYKYVPWTPLNRGLTTKALDTVSGLFKPKSTAGRRTRRRQNRRHPKRKTSKAKKIF